MNILILGSGGREHALTWKISQSKQAKKIFVAPGNAGMEQIAERLFISINDPQEVLSSIKKNRIDLVVIGPEAPLVNGLADRLREEKIMVFGPSQKAAQMEGSKAFVKELAEREKIPTAQFQSFSDSTMAKNSLSQRKFPLVVKADGLAAGKGVLICQTEKEAKEAIDAILDNKQFGTNQSKLIIEDFLTGEEASFMALCDGRTILPLASSQDHKRIFDHDEGPNTGGMGAYSPAPIVTEKVHEKVLEKILYPTLHGLKKDHISYQGVLYAGLMIDQQKPSLLEYNVRFGDPECQTILPRLRTDFVDLILATIEGRLDKIQLEWDPQFSVCVVLAAEGYPDNSPKGDTIEGIEAASKMENVFVFHAATDRKNNQWITNGGRVLGVTALGETLPVAIERAYQAVEKISWRGMQYRKDIGRKGLTK